VVREDQEEVEVLGVIQVGIQFIKQELETHLVFLQVRVIQEDQVIKVLRVMQKVEILIQDLLI
tara:strand:+ start:211 stop:399 length:189 start_codon:yes stop_codon:yes gene_type:complete